MNVDYEKIEKAWFTPKEKTARKMFMELGYKFISYGDKTIIQYRKENNSDMWADIVFNLENKTFWCGGIRNVFYDNYVDKKFQFIQINIKLLKAINKQAEELWGGK